MNASNKQNKLLITHITTWINVKGITASEKGQKNQSPKVTYYMISFIEHSLNDKIIEMENNLVVTGIGWKGRGCGHKSET